MNVKKYNFVKPNIKVLSYNILNKGISLNPKKVSALINLSVPKTITNVKSFLKVIKFLLKIY